jgi:hypothetical protein
MSKYTSALDPNYRTVVDTIKGFVEFSSTRQLWNMIRREAPLNTEKEQIESMQNKMITLLELKADPNLLNHDQKSALHLAVQNHNEWAVQMLLWEGANINLLDGDGKTALQIAQDMMFRDLSNTQSKDIYEILRQAGTSMNVREELRHTLKHGEVQPVSLSYYIEGVRLDPNGARARSSAAQGPLKLSPDCQEACMNFKLVINSFCPSQEFPLRRLYQTETILDALYSEKSRDIIPPKPFPEFKSLPARWLKQRVRGTSELRFYLVPPSSKQCTWPLRKGDSNTNI